jgi:hypothetical protein
LLPLLPLLLRRGLLVDAAAVVEPGGELAVELLDLFFWGIAWMLSNYSF